MSYQFGDFVLVRFPFTDQSAKPVVATLEQALVIKRLGQLSQRDGQTLRQTLGKIIG